MHIGKKIEEVTKERGMTKAELARRVHTSRQNINTVLKKENLDTGLIKKFGRALNYDFFQHFTNAQPKEETGGITVHIVFEVPPDKLDLLKDFIPQ